MNAEMLALLDAGIAKMDAAAADRAAQRKNADRYRWLCDEAGALAIFSALYFNTPSADDLDAGVDAAIESAGCWVRPNVELTCAGTASS